MNRPEFAGYGKAIPQNYVISITLGGAETNSAPGKVVVSAKAPFYLERITWATTGDTYPFLDLESGYSHQGRSVRMRWGDEFSKMFGSTAALVSSALGDSNGFLPLPEGVLFEPGATLDLELTRLHWPQATGAAPTVWDFVFSGVSLYR